MAVELDFSQCLGQLGITYYLPTQQLPGAKPSPVLVPIADIIEPSEALQSSAAAIDALKAVLPSSQPVSQPAAVGPESQAPVKSLSEPLSESTSKAPLADNISSLFDTVPIAKKSVSEPSSPAASQVLTVRLYAWRVGPLMVVDASSPTSALPTERLLMNILLALNIKLAQLPEADALRWPLVKNNHDKTREPFLQAADMVQAYVIAQAERAPLKGVLAMGELACQLVLADKSVWQPECIRANFGQMPVYAVPSLEQLLLEPHRKAATWACIKPLIVAPASE